MSTTPDAGDGARRRTGRRAPNLGPIKQVIVFVFSAPIALASGVSGLGPQTVLAPALTWLLGFGPEKALAAATRFAAVTAVAAVAGGLVGGAASADLGGDALALLVGAVLGALFAAPLARRAQRATWRANTAIIGLGLAMFIAMRTRGLSYFASPAVAHWNSLPQLLGLGAAAGALTQALALPGGAIMVPALYFFAAFAPSEAIVLSLLVVALASILPILTYRRPDLADARYGFTVLAAGAIGGFIGGRLLPAHSDPIRDRYLIVLSAVFFGLLSIRDLMRAYLAMLRG